MVSWALKTVAEIVWGREKGHKSPPRRNWQSAWLTMVWKVHRNLFFLLPEVLYHKGISASDGQIAL